MKHALFFDIDGTIVSDITKEIPGSTKQALRKAKENGHLLFVNTGRTLCRIIPELKELPFDGFLCGCGIYLTYHDEVFFEKHLSQNTMDEIVKMAKECNVDGVFEGNDNIYCFKEPSRFEELELLKTRYLEEGLGYNTFLENNNYRFDKVYIKTDSLSDTTTFLDFLSKEMDLIRRGEDSYECVPKGFSKATAMEMVYKKFGICKNNSYAFGDSSNDITMFEAAAHTIAMGHHSKVLEPYTEFITKTVEDNGIAFALKHYGLI